MGIIRPLFVAVGLLVALGFASVALAQGNSISGTATPERASTFSNAILYVVLRETPPGMAERTATSTTVSIGSKSPPYAFNLPINPAMVNRNSSYVLQLTISEGTRILFQSRVPVLNGKPAPGNVILPAATGTLPTVSTGTLPLLIAAVLMALACALLLWRRLRLRARPALVR